MPTRSAILGYSEICSHAPKLSRGQGIRWTLMGRKSASHLGHTVLIVHQFNIRIPASEPFIIHLRLLARVSNLLVPDIHTFRRTLGISENGSV